MKPRSTFIRLLSLGLLMGACPVTADPASTPNQSGSGVAVDTSRWTCALCPYRFGWTGVIDIGGGWVSDASNKFGDYRGLEDEGGFLALDGEAHFRDRQGGFADIYFKDLGIDSRRFQASGGTRGRYTLDFRFQEIPKYRGFGTQTPYLGTGGAALALPSNWQSAQTTSGMSSLATALQSVDLQTTRKTLDAGLGWNLSRHWSWEIEYQRQEKNGTRPFGAGVFLLNASHLPVPVDFSTNRLDMGINFNGKRSHIRFGFSGSSFDNGFDSLTWENPFTPLPGPQTLRASLEPDNSFYQFDLAAAWAASPRFRLSGSAALGRMEQDEGLLPYSINPEFSDRPLPRLTADTRVDVSNVNLSGKLSARLARRLDLTATLRREERDNKTPVDIWTPIITDFVERPPRPNRPYSFERDRAGVSLRYRATSSLRLQAGGEWEEDRRTLQSVLETQEAGWFAEAGFSPGSMAELRARLEQSKRDGDPYLPVEDYALPEHPLMRKFNLADRDRERLRLDVDFYPVPELLINLAFRGGEDRYERSIIGLRQSEERSISADLSWTPSGRITAYLFVSRDDIDSLQAGGEAPSPSPWLATTDDRFLTAGLGLTARLSDRTEIGLDLVSSNADGDIRTDSGAGEPAFPTLETQLRNARLRFEYRPTPHWGVKLYLEHEKFDSSDWALDGYGPAGIPAILTFGAESPDYSVTVVRAQASYKF